MAAYPRYSQTIAALQNVGQTVNTLNALDLAKRNAELEHELNMTKLNLQKVQTEQQGRLGLLNAENTAAERLAAQKFREQQAGFENRRINIAEDEAAARETDREAERFNTTVAPLGEVYSMVLDRQKVTPERKASMLKGMKSIVDSVNPNAWSGILTTPAKAQEVIMDIEKMRNDLAMRQISNGTPGAAAKTLLNQAKYFADQYTSGRVDPNDPEVRRQIAEFGQMGIEISSTMGTKDVNGEVVQTPVYTVKMVDPYVATTTRYNMLNEELLRKYPAYSQMETPARMNILKQYKDLDDTNNAIGKENFIKSIPEFNVVQPFAPGTKPGKMPTTGGLLRTPSQTKTTTPQTQGMEIPSQGKSTLGKFAEIPVKNAEDYWRGYTNALDIMGRAAQSLNFTSPLYKQPESPKTHYVPEEQRGLSVTPFEEERDNVTKYMRTWR